MEINELESELEKLNMYLLVTMFSIKVKVLEEMLYKHAPDIYKEYGESLLAAIKDNEGYQSQRKGLEKIQAAISLLASKLPKP